ncbi:MAG: site-2 protease family protein [Hyphomicrobiales bacterium]
MRNIRIGKLLGIPILINPSWFVLLGLTTWLLAARVFPDSFGEASTQTYVLMALASVLLFFASIVLHELAHSAVARAYQIPVRSITLFVFGGVAQITREAKRPLAELLMAAAGPLTSLVLGVLFLGAWWALGAQSSRPVDHVIVWLGITNGALAVFNLIPAFPMDGGRIFRSLIWLIGRDYNRATTIAAWTGRGFAWLLMATGFLAFLNVNVYVAEPGFSGLWLVFIGLFLENAARSSLLQNRYIQALDRVTIGEIMIPDPPVIDPDMTVASLARGVLEINPRVCYFVEDEGRLAGIISGYQMYEVPEGLWDSVTAGQAMIPRDRLLAVDPDKKVSEILLDMEQRDLTHMPVVREGRVVGVVGRDRILNVLRQAGLLRLPAR